jgi:hypothetical protein
MSSQRRATIVDSPLRIDEPKIVRSERDEHIEIVLNITVD